MNRFFPFLFFVSLIVFSQQDKRLALVIGNADYEKGELKNPVNDARLIASTLDSLDFDVILKENLATKRDMTAAIREFGARRSEYDVAFVYYAGHGIQVDDENFLLPTKEVFEEEFDVMDYGVSVQNIMRYLRAQTNEVNILILDACRDNPFESNWNTTRSLKGGGLAKIPPPTGSLIAFSTDSGQTAPDGDGENSIYTISLAKNMILQDTSIDQVFRNVRAEVLEKTNGVQRPVEATQLTGQTLYLKKQSREYLIKKINKLLVENQIEESIRLSNELIIRFQEDPYGYIKLAQAYQINNDIENSLSNYMKAIEIDPSIDEIYLCLLNNESVNLNQVIGLKEIFYDTDLKNWKKIFLNYHHLDNNNPIANYVLGQLYYFNDISKSKYYFERVTQFANLKSIPSLLDNENKNINILSESIQWLIYVFTQLGEYNRALKYASQLEKTSLIDYDKATLISSKAEIYLKKRDTLRAISLFEDAIEIYNEPVTHGFLSDIYLDIFLRTKLQKDIEKAFFYITQQINYSEENSRQKALGYFGRANLHLKYTKNFVAALTDLGRVNEIYYKLYNQPNIYALTSRQKIYADNEMFDYWCIDLFELKKIVDMDLISINEIEFIKKYFFEVYEMDFDSIFLKLENNNCMSLFNKLNE